MTDDKTVRSSALAEYEQALAEFNELTEQIASLIRERRAPSEDLLEREANARLRLIAARKCGLPPVEI
jgi:hypothetical protein